MARRQRPIVMATLLAEASGALQPVLRRALDMQAEQTRLRALLDTEASAHVDAAYLRGDTLVIVVRTSVWATRLRFLAPALLQRLADSGIDGAAEVRQVRVTVGRIVHEPPPANRAPRPSVPSAESASVLSKTAATLPADDPLRRALERIASRSRNTRKD